MINQWLSWKREQLDLSRGWQISRCSYQQLGSAVLLATCKFKSADQALSPISALPMLLYRTGRRKRRRRRRGGGERSRIERGEGQGAGKYSSVARGPRPPPLRRRLCCSAAQRVRACVCSWRVLWARWPRRPRTSNSTRPSRRTTTASINRYDSNNVTVTIHCCTITRRLATMESIVALSLAIIVL